MLRKNALENPTMDSRQAARPCPLGIPAKQPAQTFCLFEALPGFALPVAVGMPIWNPAEKLGFGRCFSWD